MTSIRTLVVAFFLSLAVGCGGGDKGKNKDMDVPKAPNTEAKK